MTKLISHVATHRPPVIFVSQKLVVAFARTTSLTKDVDIETRSWLFRPIVSTGRLTTRDVYRTEPRPPVPYRAIMLFATRYRRYSVYRIRFSKRNMRVPSVEGFDHDLLYDEDGNNRIIGTEYVRDCSSSYERDQSREAFSSFWPVLYRLVRSYGHFSMYYFAHTTRERERERELVVYSVG